MLPAAYNLVIAQRATFRQRFKIPLDFTDREVCAQIWKTQAISATKTVRTEKVLDFTVDWVDRALIEDDVTKGVFDIVATHTATASLSPADQLEWDLLVVDGETLHDGDRTFWLDGTVTLDPGLTECLEGD